MLAELIAQSLVAILYSSSQNSLSDDQILVLESLGLKSQSFIHQVRILFPSLTSTSRFCHGVKSQSFIHQVRILSAKVNAACGLHVHVDGRNPLFIKSEFSLFNKFCLVLHLFLWSQSFIHQVRILSPSMGTGNCSRISIM